MADVITRFKLETTQYDSKLRDAAKGLKEVAHQAELGGKNFTGFNQKAIDAARALGTIESGANNTKDRLKDLVGSFNDAAKAYNNLSKEQQQSDFGKAMAQSLEQLQVRIKDTKQELYGLGNAVEDVKQKSGGLFGEGGFTGMLQVAGGNMLAAGIQKIGSAMADTIQQSIQLARQGEGIRIAFERLNRPDLLDNLKESTHGTVSEIELMKQAIKFENFKLPLEDLATYLAFAQQKAKDTGESIDYLVTSIVNGLGRQSKQILDNLGISAAELTKRMSDGADMTKAVADIIREEMEKAGDYVETAADRAARAAAKVNDEMEEFGRQAAPIAEEWSNVWNSLTIGAMEFGNYIAGPLAKSIRSIQNILAVDSDGSTFKDRLIAMMFKNMKGTDDGKWSRPRGYTSDYQSVTAPGGYVEVTDANTGAVIGGQHFDDLNDKNAIMKWRRSLHKTPKTTGKTTAEKIGFDANKALLAAEMGVDTMPSVWSLMKDSYTAGYDENGRAKLGFGDDALRDMLGIGKQQSDLGKILKEYVADPDAKKRKDLNAKADTTIIEGFSAISNSISGIFSGIEALGIEIPSGLKEVLGGIQAVASILTGISALVSVITTIQGVKSTPIIGEFLAGGGIAHAANGFIGGNTFSGDQIPIMVNSGELILNRAQQGNLASQLSGGGMQNLQLEAVVRGEDLRFIINSNGRRTGRGEIVTTNFR